MKNMIQKKCDLLIENQAAIQKAFLFENGLIRTIAASSFTEQDKTLDVELMKEARSILRKKQGMFSELRGNNEIIASAKMALSGSPERYIDEVIEVYKKFQKGKFFDSAFRALSAMTICDLGKYEEADAIIEKTNEIISGMKKDHPFLTSDEDTCFATLLALTDKSVDDILAELEDTYQYIKKSFAFHDNASYSLSQVLTTYGGNSEAKREKAIEIFNAFTEAGEKYGKNYELASIGTLIDIEVPTQELVSEIIDAADYLKGNKGFGLLDMSKQTRLLFANMLVTNAYGGESQKTAASVASGVVAQVIAAQVAMMVVIMSLASTSAASSSH